MFQPDESARRCGVTAVDNLFMLDYLPAASGDYVKIYLYVLYMSQHGIHPESVDEIAKELSFEKPTVEGALRYWERRHLLVRESDEPLLYTLKSPLQLLLAGDAGIEADDAFVAFSEDVYALFGDRRKVRPAEIALAYEWVQDIGLKQEAVLMLLSHCISTRGTQFSFKAAQAIALRMREEKVVSAEDAEAFFDHTKQETEGARAVLRRMGKKRAPTQDEMDLYHKWLISWKYTPDAILTACAEMTRGDPSFAYLDKILEGIRTRAGQKNDMSESSVKKQLSGERGQMENLKAFAKMLGNSSPDSLRATFNRLCGEYSPDLVILSAQQAQKARQGLEGVENYLRSLKKMGITSREEAVRVISEREQANATLTLVFEACGYGGHPAPADRALYKKWRSWGFDEEIMLLAAEQSRAAEHPVPYLDKVLEAWHEAGVTSASQVSARPAARPQKTAAAGAGGVSARQYTQREYSDDELNALAADIMEEARSYNEQPGT